MQSLKKRGGEGEGSLELSSIKKDSIVSAFGWQLNSTNVKQNVQGIHRVKPSSVLLQAHFRGRFEVDVTVASDVKGP